jgi:hypothetical protein
MRDLQNLRREEWSGEGEGVRWEDGVSNSHKVVL